MKRRYKIILTLALTAITVSLGAVEAFALTEAEVQAQVNAVGKEVVTGNLFVWFLCAVAFLKVSQKIDSFMSSLGINVGHTGGSMLSELMIAARGVATARGMSGGGRGSGGGSGGEDFLKGGLIGAAGRSIERGAAQNATGSGSGGLGGVAYNSSVQEGGGFANRVIGSIATGKISTDGTISGENAPQALREPPMCLPSPVWRLEEAASLPPKFPLNTRKALPWVCTIRTSTWLRRVPTPR